ncbi:SEL1-like repeat protein [Cellvibrio sp. pealriver]|uniref:SEL1-like repeat protein n=1 Tax=Cellvibrio sp. pealriver TaxID=1622269 RepID=UPI00069E1593|nr:SEL1-like repeat protein [Cellvibrio sp. pealriver]
MKILPFLMLILCSHFVLANEPCSLADIKLTEDSPQAERLFYTGTCHYRNEQYEKSVALWKELSLLDDIPDEYVELQISALSNLGYMLFFGYGVKENKTEAIDYWNRAVALGHTEAEYHLCHAIADHFADLGKMVELGSGTSVRLMM